MKRGSKKDTQASNYISSNYGQLIDKTLELGLVPADRVLDLINDVYISIVQDRDDQREYNPIAEQAGLVADYDLNSLFSMGQAEDCKNEQQTFESQGENNILMEQLVISRLKRYAKNIRYN